MEPSKATESSPSSLNVLGMPIELIGEVELIAQSSAISISGVRSPSLCVLAGTLTRRDGVLLVGLSQPPTQSSKSLGRNDLANV